MCVSVCGWVCAGEQGSGLKAVMGKMKSVFEVPVYSRSSAESEGQGVREKVCAPHTRTHTQTKDTQMCRFSSIQLLLLPFHWTTNRQRCSQRKPCSVIWYSWHAYKHTTVCHLLSPEQINAREKSIPIRIPLLYPACGCRWIDIKIPLLTCRPSLRTETLHVLLSLTYILEIRKFTHHFQMCPFLGIEGKPSTV